MKILLIFLVTATAVTAQDNGRYPEPPRKDPLGYHLRSIQRHRRDQELRRQLAFGAQNGFFNFHPDGNRHPIGIVSFPAALSLEDVRRPATATPVTTISTVSGGPSVHGTASPHTASTTSNIPSSVGPTPKSIVRTEASAGAESNKPVDINCRAAVSPTVASQVSPTVAAATPETSESQSSPALTSSTAAVMPTEAPATFYNPKATPNADISYFLSQISRNNNNNNNNNLATSHRHLPPEIFHYNSAPPSISSPERFSVADFPISGLSAVPNHAETINNIPSSLSKIEFAPLRGVQIPPQPSDGGPVRSFDFGRGFGTIENTEQTRNLPFPPGLRLNLGGFGGIDYGARQRASAPRPVTLGIAKVGLSLPESPRPPIPAFTKIGFGRNPW